MDCTVHRTLQARILEWVTLPFSRGSSQPRDQTQVSGIAGGFFYQLSHEWRPSIRERVADSFSSGSSWPRNWTRVSCIVGGFLTDPAIRESPVPKPNIKGQKVGGGSILGNLHPFPNIVAIILPLISLWNYPALYNWQPHTLGCLTLWDGPHSVYAECIFLSKPFTFLWLPLKFFPLQINTYLVAVLGTPWDINISLAPLSFLFLFLFLTALPQCGLLVPRLGIKPVPLAWQLSLTTGLPGKSPHSLSFSTTSHTKSHPWHLGNVFNALN